MLVMASPVISELKRMLPMKILLLVVKLKIENNFLIYSIKKRGPNTNMDKQSIMSGRIRDASTI